jgi:V/A-type H+-transporting ATPase subunit D
MDPREFPTKGNLMLAKNSLALANQGYELMDKKRNILIRELMELIEEAKDIQEQIDQTFTKAYACLQRANIEHGISWVEELAYTVPIEDSIQIQTRSIMGTEIPHVKYSAQENQITYTFRDTHESLDIAREAFRQAKDLTIELSRVENAAYRLAASIKKTQKRANALKNITIPTYTELVTNISNALEEKEREEFTRLKVIKKRKMEQDENVS